MATAPTDRQITIRWSTAIEALEAVRAIKRDKLSYIHQRMTDDVSIFLAAEKDLERAIEVEVQ